MPEFDGVQSEWHASEEILFDFITFGRNAALARNSGDLQEYMKALESMWITIDAFIDSNESGKIKEQMLECQKALGGIGHGAQMTFAMMEVFTDCDRLIRRAAQAHHLLIKEADTWDIDIGGGKDEEDFTKWREKRKKQAEE
jgi:hypothetical protein